MNKLNAIIIEDEIPAARLLHSMITRLRPQWTLTIVPGSVDEAHPGLKKTHSPTLSFLIFNWQTVTLSIFFLPSNLLLSLSSPPPMTNMPYVHLP